MAEERNLHMKLAGAEVLGLVAIGWVTFVLAMYGLKVFDIMAGLSTIAGILPWAGGALLLCTLAPFINENMLLTAVFGPLAFFFIAAPGFITAGTPAMYATIFIGIVLLLDALVAFMQPVKLLPILLLVAAILFFVLGAWVGDAPKYDTSDMRMIVGVFSLLTFLIATYMAVAIGILTVKGKMLLPLLVTK